MLIMKAEKEMSKRPGKIKSQDGFTLMELVIATAVIGIMAAVAVPQFTAYKARVYDANVQSDLRSVFTTCQAVWAFKGSNNPCLLATLSNSEFGFTPSTDVEVTINSDDNNTEYDFYATASHSSSSNTFAIDYRGVITKISVEGQDGNDDEKEDEKDDGNKGNGCSEEAHTDPHDLGGNAKGGCGTSDANNSGNNSGPSGPDNSGPSNGNNSGPDKWWKQWGNEWWK